MKYSTAEIEAQSQAIKLAFKAVLGREISDAELEQRLTKPFSSSDLLEELTTSEEFIENKCHAIKLAFRAVLGREISDAELEKRMKNPFSFCELLEELTASEEFVENNYHEHKNKIPLIENVYKELLHRSISDKELDDRLSHWQPAHQFINEVLFSDEYKDKKEVFQIDITKLLGPHMYLLGSSLPCSVEQILNWYRAIAENLLLPRNESGLLNKHNNKSLSKTQNENYELVILTSMYKGGNYIESFLESIVGQTVFDQCQLFIVDASSPDDEWTTIKRYQEKFPNIRYERLNSVVGIYEAWNYAINNSDSKYITNANLDDLHRCDALELKVQALEENPKMDVAYSDVFYSFIPNVPYEVFCKGGIRTNLPTASVENLLQYNSPHNAPVWRRKLHDEIGLFDSEYQSAGDHEFWLRAAFSEKHFIKIDEAVTGYLHNIDGISTRTESKGVVEGQQILKKYTDLLLLESNS